MNPRQLHALTHPLTTVDDPVADFRTVRQRGDGSLLVVVLAVDR